MTTDDMRPRAAMNDTTHKIYSSPETVEIYADLAEEEGLFPEERKAIDRHFTQSGASVLDVGCGAGRVAHPLHEHGFDVTGIDISEPLIEAARERFPSIDFRVADITDSDLATRSFDYVMFPYNGLDCIHPEDQRKRALREIFRVLKPSGLFAFSSHNSWTTGPALLIRNFDYLKDLYFTRKNLSRLFSRAKILSVDEGELEIYFSNPLHQWRQLRTCGFTLLDVIGQREGAARYFVRCPCYVAKK